MLHRPILHRGLLALLLVLFAFPFSAGAQTERIPTEKMVTLTLPEGDPPSGRKAFVAMGCPSCHEVLGERDFPTPVSPNRGPTLGSYQAHQEPARLAMSIYSPSHEITGMVREEQKGELSPMPDFTEAVTVRDFLDLIAFIRSLGDRK